MGCFLGCFGKDRRRRNQRRPPSPGGQQRHGGQHHLQYQTIPTVVPTEEDIKCSPPKNLITDLSDIKPEELLSSSSKKNVADLGDDKTEEPLSSNSKKKVSDMCGEKPLSSSNSKKRVTFDSNVTTYEPVSVIESVDSLLVPEQKEKEVSAVALPSDSRSTSEDDSVTSSVGSYPPNHRYQNCRDSDDEDIYEDSDLEGLDEYDDEEGYSDEDVEQSMESRTGNVEDHLDEVESPMVLPFRSRNDYLQVLNPVENISQWKTLKSKGFNPGKENSTDADLKAPPIPFSSEPSFKPKSEGKKSSTQEIAVDASLSTWLSDSGPSPAKITSHGSPETVSQDKVRTFEDRPILGALTVDELKQQMSASSSPRKSPSRSPDDMYIIGSVGSYWNESVSSKESRSGSSFKGIPNTTSKYREDKRVNWHSTPFETRLERALNQKAGGV